MNNLIHNLTRFINITLELYAALPYQYTIDLHTLNAYIKTYDEKEDKLIEGFVNRLADKLAAKNKCDTIKEENTDIASNGVQEVLKHYNSCSSKFPQLKLQLAHQNFDRSYNDRSYNQDSKANSYSSDTSRNEGIKPNRHKFATRNKPKQLVNLSGDNKQNISVVCNINTTRDILQESYDRSLKFIKSSADLIMPSYSPTLRNISIENKRQDKSVKARPRYESNDNKVNPWQLKIKIKPKPPINLRKIIQNINQVSAMMVQNDDEIDSLMSHLDYQQSQQQHKLVQ